jgi:hypothetical protein
MTKKKKPLGQKSGPENESLAEAARRLTAGLPPEDPLAWFQTHAADLDGREAGLIEAVSKTRTEDVQNFFLSLLNALKDKNQIKAVRKAVYRLEQAGITGDPALRDRGPSMVAPPPPKSPKGILSIFDYEGTRRGCLALPDPVHGYEAIVFTYNFVEGLIDFEVYDWSAGDLKAFLRPDPGDTIQRYHEVPPEAVRFCLEEAVQWTRAMNRVPPADYFKCLSSIRAVPLPSRPLIHDLLPPDFEPEQDDLTEATERLLEDDFVGEWHLEDIVDPHLEALFEKKESSLVLTEQQRLDRLSEQIQQATAGIFTPSFRRELKRRLEELALLYHLSGDADLARNAVSAALDLGREDDPFRAGGFCFAIFQDALLYLLHVQHGELREELAARGEETDSASDPDRMPWLPKDPRQGDDETLGSVTESGLWLPPGVKEPQSKEEDSDPGSRLWLPPGVKD